MTQIPQIYISLKLDPNLKIIEFLIGNHPQLTQTRVISTQICKKTTLNF